MATTKRANDGKMRRVAEGVYIRNGVYIVPIWNPQKGSRGGKDFHRFGHCPCGAVHPGSTLTDAKALKRKLENKKASSRQHRNGGEGPLTVADWAGYYTTGSDEKWMPGRWLKRFPRPAETTNIHNDERSRAFAREFAGRTMESITKEEAKVIALEHPSSFKVLHSMFNDAKALQLVDRNPFAGLTMPAREGRKDIVVLTDAELEQLSGIARVVHGVSYGPLFAAMIEVAAWTGIRPSELFLLALEPARSDRPEDRVNFVDLKAGLVHVDWQRAKTGKITRPKHESQREVVLLPAAEAALRSIAHGPGPLLFRTKRHKPYTARSHFYYWDPVRSAFVASLPAGHHLRQRTSETGGENLDFYELRHYFGTKLAHPPAGITPASPYEIAEMMGHKDGGQLAMERYIHAPAQEAQNSIRNAWRRAS